MLVLQPRMTRLADCTGGCVNDNVGTIGVKVGAGDKVIVTSAVTGDITVTFEEGVDVSAKTGGGMINGVGVTIPGVEEEMGVKTGNG